MSNAFDFYKQSESGMQSAFVDHAESLDDLLNDAVVCSMVYSQFSELLHDKPDRKNRRILLEKHPKRDKIISILNDPLASMISNTLAPLKTIDTKRGLRFRLVAEKAVFRANIDGKDVVVNIDSTLFESVSGLNDRMKMLRDGLLTLRSRHLRSFKTLATKRRPGVWECLDTLTKFVCSTDTLSIAPSADVEMLDPPTEDTLSIAPSADVEMLDPPTDATIPKKRVAITVLFQKKRDVRNLKDFGDMALPKVHVHEALVLVEVDDLKGRKGASASISLHGAVFLYLKAAKGFMNSTAKSRMHCVQTVLSMKDEVCFYFSLLTS